jgi:hypothetical protein
MKIKSFNKYSFKEIIEFIRDDNSIDTHEKLLLIFLFSYKSTEFPPLAQIAQETAISLEKAREIITDLKQSDRYGQPLKSLLEKSTDIMNQKGSSKHFNQPQDSEKNDLYNRPGSKVARKWNEVFGTTQLSPTNFNKLRSFIDDGIDEEVIIGVMNISAEKAKGNPINYTINILNNYLDRDILSYEDFEKERRRRKDYEEQVQKNIRAEEKREELHNINNLKEKGWNK